ncbi:MAG: cytochrome b/b6 domain-containing protein [Chloroflexi bacterium]|nr:cytochrome b/b6 domain-containing protein [Chloroflexota bacterium]
MASIAQTTTVAKPAQQDMIARFDVHQRIQHILMLSSFLILAATGLPQKFADNSISQWWINVLAGVERARAIHHFAGWVMIFSCVYHAAYVTYSTLFLKRPFPTAMIPNLKDIRDFIHELRYFFRLEKERPKFGRFSYHEKFDYWAIFWGIPIMAGSGLILMYPVLASKVLPSYMVPVSQVAHSDEAVLAVLWIFIVHFYYVHLSPHFFPFNGSIFTGKMPKERYMQEHPLEFEQLMAQQEGESEKKI